MYLYEKEFCIPLVRSHEGLLFKLSEYVLDRIPSNEAPVRFVITRTDERFYHCEVGILSGSYHHCDLSRECIFQFGKREAENIENFNAVLIVPTGIGAEIGGHSGDAGPVARLLAASCDTLITHPNVVNASDINELPENGLYVEGSVITRLMMGCVGLQRSRSNRVILIIDKHEDKLFYESAVNAASAARAALGLECPAVVMMEDKLSMRSLYSSSGRAIGRIDNFNYLCELLTKRQREFDAIALSSVIRVPLNFHRDYYLMDVVNPWGGVEAMLTHAISLIFDVPSAHSPMLESREILDLELGVVDPRKSAEIISMTFLHSVLKGLHKSPRIRRINSASSQPHLLTVSDVSCLVIPYGCIGLPTLAALEQGIPVIAVRENRNRMANKLEDLPFGPGKLFIVENYLEAVGVMSALKGGVAVESVRRPLKKTEILTYNRMASPLDWGASKDESAGEICQDEVGNKFRGTKGRN